MIDPAGLLEHFLIRSARSRSGSKARVINYPADLRPILCRLAEVAYIGMGSRSRHHFLGVVRQEAFVHTDNAHPGLHHSFVRGIHQLLIIKPPHVLGWAAWIAHGVALP